MGAAVVLAPGAAVGAEGWQLGNSLGGGVGSGRTLATAAAAAIVIGPSASLSSDPTFPPLSAMLVGPCLADWLTPDGLYRCGWATAPHENQAAAIVVAVAAGWGPSTPLSPPRFSAAQRSGVCVFFVFLSHESLLEQFELRIVFIRNAFGFRNANKLYSPKVATVRPNDATQDGGAPVQQSLYCRCLVSSHSI